MTFDPTMCRVEVGWTLEKCPIWTLPILVRRNEKELELEDIPTISEINSARTLGSEISNLWEKEPEGKGRLWKILLRKFGASFSTVLIVLLFQQCALRLSWPILLGLLIRFLSGHFSSTAGIILAISFGISIFLSSILFHPCIFTLQKMGMRMRIGLTNLLYQKVLRLSQKSVSESGIGQLTNILSNDVNRFDDVMEFIPFVFIGPCQVVAVTFILWKYTGPSCLTGLGLLLLLMPIEGFIGKEFGRLRQKVASITDRRVRSLTELLSGILLVKMSAWEDTYAENINDTRRSELKVIQRKNRFFSLNHTLFISSTKLSVLLTFLSFVLTGHDLSAEAVFVTLSMYNTIGLTVGVFLPFGISGLSEMIVSIRRIQSILLLEEKGSNDSNEVNKKLNTGVVAYVNLRNVNGSWGNGEETLKNISLQATSGSLIGIIGPVGSGKSSILQAILHELPLEDPNSVTVRGSIAYASQEPCLFPDSIRNNILMGRNHEPVWYDQVIDACGLTSDLALFPYADETLVGDKGVTLSGGQKARVNLARAVYSRAEIYLLDDPLSALDVRVARHVKEKCIDGLLGRACVILVTHQTHFLREGVREIISIENGQVVRRGSYVDIFLGGSADLQLLDDPSEASESLAIDDIEMDEDSAPASEKLSFRPMKIEDTNEVRIKPKAEAELRRRGSVGWGLFFTYFKAGNSTRKLIFLIILTLATQAIQNGSDVWLKIWADKEQNVGSRNSSSVLSFLPQLPHHLEYVELYAFLVFLFFVVAFWRVLSIYGALLSSGASLHKNLFNAILRAPMSFFQTNSEGLILKLFSNDVGAIDERIPTLFYNFIGTTLQVIGSMTLVSLMSPILLIPTFILIFTIYRIQGVYVKSSGSLKRIEGIARSPVFAQLTTTLSSLATIRAFRAQSHFYAEFVQVQDTHSSAFFLYLASFRWLTTTLELVSDMYINVVMVFLLATHADSAAFGLAITAALCLINDGTGMIMFSAQLINQMISAERVIDYAQIEPEESPEVAMKLIAEVDPTWPQNGTVKFEGIVVAYKNSPNILEDIDLTIRDGEKIGIIGRTGAGKTSLVAALFRIINPKQGEIRISGFPTQKLPLKQLRNQLSIIPQNPVLLAGTLRSNLDPFSEYSDDFIWEALEVVQLKKRINETAQGLAHEVSEGGLNFSQGERQLISLARTILRKNKILVLDEATANIDTKTDGIIQKALRERFKDSTVLTIAHRLETVMDSDRILVLDGGKIKEFDSPAKLLSSEGSFLFQLVQKTGTRNATKLMRMIKLNT